MAILCPEHKLLFVMVPGTACSVIGSELQRHLGGVWLPEKELVVDGRIVLRRKHNTVEQMLRAGVLSEKDCDDLLIFATARNPYDRFVTYYQRLVGDWADNYLEWTANRLERERENLTDEEYDVQLRRVDHLKDRKERRVKLLKTFGFNNWLKATLIRWKYADLRKPSSDGGSMEKSFPMLGRVNVAIRYERLEEGLNQVLRMAGVTEPISIPQRNVTPGKRSYKEYYSRSTRYFVQATLKDQLATFGYDFDGPTTTGSIIQLKPTRRATVTA